MRQLAPRTADKRGMQRLHVRRRPDPRVLHTRTRIGRTEVLVLVQDARTEELLDIFLEHEPPPSSRRRVRRVRTPR